MTERERTIIGLWSYVQFVALAVCRSWGVNDLSVSDDCRSVATEAMILAVDSYQLDFGTSLRTWASRNAAWAVKGYLEKMFADGNRMIPLIDGKLIDGKLIDGIRDKLGNSVDDGCCNSDLTRKVFQGLDRAAVEMLWRYFFEGFTMGEIAHTRKCSTANISLKISRIKSDIYRRYVLGNKLEDAR